jgi:hypothetical protein
MGLDASNLIINHLKLRPEALPRDVYKLLFQGVFGVGHIISDHAWEVLVEEAGRIDLDDHIDDPLFEPVSPDGLMVRVNLRQYINRGGNLETLFRVMRESAKVQGEQGVFLDYWGQFKELVNEGKLEFSLRDIKRLDEVIERDGVRPMHHTEAYREAYYPAYRVVLLSVYEKLMGISGYR